MSNETEEGERGSPFDDPDKYRCEVSGAFYILKDSKYRPWEANLSGSGRFNSLGTGSVYLGDSIATCEAEVSREGRDLWRCDISGTGFFDMTAVVDEHPHLAEQVLVPSGSGGWEPTQEIASKLHEAGFSGIKFYSHHGREHINVVYWQDRHEQHSGSFVPHDD